MPCVYATPRYCPASCHPKSHLGSICSVYDSVCTEHMCTYKSCSPPGLQVQQEEAAAAAQNPVAQSSHAAGPLFALCFPASHAMHSSSVESYPRLVYVWKSHGRNIYARSHTRAQAQIILLACTQALSPKLLTSVVTSGACPVWQLQLVPCPGPAHVRVCLCFSPGPTSMHEDEAKRSVGLCIPSRDKAPLGQAACACPRKRSKSPILRSARSIGFVGDHKRFRLFYLVHILYLSSRRTWSEGAL